MSSTSAILTPTAPVIAFSVTKRDGSVAPFNSECVLRAVSLAFFEARIAAVNPYRGDRQAQFGLPDELFATCHAVTFDVVRALLDRYSDQSALGVELIQDEIEAAIARTGAIDVVRSFMSYRSKHAAVRPVSHGESGLQDYIAFSRYCRFSAELGRREVWPEAVARVRDMHLRRFASKLVNAASVQQTVERLIAEGVITAEAVQDAGGFAGLADEINSAFQLVSEKKVLPSMRSLQFGGKAIEEKNARMFNCAFTQCNRPDFFKDGFYLLLCGCGVGFSVQKHHVASLPALAARPDEIALAVEHFLIPDTIEGWSDAVAKLVDSYIKGYKVEFSYHQIRAYGSLIKSSGGRAPGHLPLKKALDKCDAILAKAAGRNLRPIEAYDVFMHLAKAVLAGGSRRSATIALFSHDDEEMISAKTGDWFSENEQRSASNNSAVLVRSEATEADFKRIFEKIKQFGEPGFFFADDKEVGANPCVEIQLNPKLVVTEKVRDRLIELGYYEPLNIGDVLTGTQMCNLTTMSGGAAVTPEQFFRLSKAAAAIGTLQADYTDMPYLGAVTRVLNEREALIGVSICGILDNPQVLLDPVTLQRGAAVVKATNAVIAALIGINRAARTTCVKPEGTSSLVLNTGSGISPHHDRRYFRRVQAAYADPVLKLFQSLNPHMVEKSVYDPNGATAVITFPVEGPKQGIYRSDLPALRHLDYVRLVQENWVMPGQAYTTYTSGHHNVSNTINVDTTEWDEAGAFIWENRHVLTGIALLANTGDKAYAQSPRESLATEGDVRKWNALTYTPVDYTKVGVKEDETAGHEHRGAATACAGGKCEL